MIRFGSLSRRKADSRRHQATEDSPPLTPEGGHIEDAPEGRRQVASQVLLGDVAGRPGPEGPDGDFLAAEGRHQDHGDLGMMGPHPLDQLQALHVRHDQVREDDGWGLARDGLEPLAAVAGINHPHVLHGFQQLVDEVAVECGIIHDQDRRDLARRERRVRVAPRIDTVRGWAHNANLPGAVRRKVPRQAGPADGSAVKVIAIIFTFKSSAYDPMVRVLCGRTRGRGKWRRVR